MSRFLRSLVVWLRMAAVGLAMLYAALACQLLTLGRWIWPGRKP